MLNLFVTGTGKGKNLVTAGLAITMQSLGYATGVYVPVQCGAVVKNGFIHSPDLVFIKNMDENIKTYCSYLFKSHDLPLISAAAEGQKIDKDVIYEDFNSINDKFECLLTNGTNGIATPLGVDFLEIDLVKTLNLPLLLTISPSVSAVSDILIMINHAVVKNVEMRGVIINNCPLKTDNENIKNLPKLIEKYTDTRILGVLPAIENPAYISAGDLISYVLAGVNLESIFNIKIAKLHG